tara:strand:+ start:53 stop:658 length:606 start_codon:yes stop_codon:yes gene_type:complete
MIGLLPLFPSSVYHFTLEEDTSELDPRGFEYNKQYFPSGAAATENIRVLDEFPNTKRIILKKFNDIAKNQLGLDNEFKLSTSWFTKVEKGGHAIFHCHRNCFYSGIYYFGDNYPESSGRLCFRSNIEQYSDFLIKSNKRDLLNATTWTIQPKRKKMVLFPSYLEHAILEHMEDATRYSLAFNFYPVGEYGFGDSTFNTDWK